MKAVLSAVLAVGSLTMIGSSEAQADWQWSKWGMTPTEVLAASHGTAFKNTDAGKHTDDMAATLAAPYVAGELEFTAYFMFGRASGALEAVLLYPTNPENCPFIAGTLSQTYGRPEHIPLSFGELRKWEDAAHGNHVVYLEIGSTCDVQYKPMLDANAPGGL